MKYFTFILSAFLFFSSCNSSQGNKQSSEAIDSAEVTLSADQVNKITRIHSVFAEVYPISLKESLTNFKSDQDPDKEIEVWLNMVSAYEKYLNTKNNKLDLNTKKEVFKLILERSMMVDKEAIANSKLLILTPKDAEEVLSFYTAPPEPIDTTGKK
jgi:Ethanolamine utilization protein EutJ (predicted chaperonin)